ncbi:hypothetical protein SBADM41S_00574 [Streptomyces badius]
MHQEGLAGAQMGHHEDVGPHRGGDLGQRRGLHQADALRYGEELAGGCDLLRVTAARQQGAHLVADRPPGHPGTERDDTARALQSGVGGRAGRRIVEALPPEHVGTVHSAGDDLDEDLAVAGYGIGHLGPHERLGAAGFGNRDRMHGREATPAALARADASSIRVAGAEASGSSGPGRTGARPDDGDDPVRQLQGAGRRIVVTEQPVSAQQIYDQVIGSRVVSAHLGLYDRPFDEIEAAALLDQVLHHGARARTEHGEAEQPPGGTGAGDHRVRAGLPEQGRVLLDGPRRRSSLRGSTGARSARPGRRCRRAGSR